MKKQQKSSYAESGVDIDEMMTALSAVKKMIKKTTVSEVCGDIGSFGGLFSAPGKNKTLVASTDGVGTKLKVAVMANRHTTIGQDLVNHCVNDILVQGAKPLFFMDYIGTAKLEANIFKDIISGLCKACRYNKCALLGGETAEMPGLYPEGEYDLVGTIIGVADKKKIITGKNIQPGDIIIGIPSSGLHTNGYSFARRVIFDKLKLKIDDPFPGMEKSVADILLTVHKSYLRPVSEVMKNITIRGMAHITGGGLIDNIPRILPLDTVAVIDRSSWKVPAIFQLFHNNDEITIEEMYRVFNMGIGFVLIVQENDVYKTIDILRRMRCYPRPIGYIKKRSGANLSEAIQIY